jgi:DNA repair protein RadC
MLTVTECAAKRRPAPMPSLYIRIGGKYVPASEEVLLERLHKWAATVFRAGALVLEHPRIIEAFLLSKLAAREHEVFAIILLDSEHRLIEYIETSQGDMNSATIYSREIVKVALRYNASSPTTTRPVTRTLPSKTSRPHGVYRMRSHTSTSA